jgi:hypothetical protein
MIHPHGPAYVPILSGAQATSWCLSGAACTTCCAPSMSRASPAAWTRCWRNWFHTCTPTPSGNFTFTPKKAGPPLGGPPLLYCVFDALVPLPHRNAQGRVECPQCHVAVGPAWREMVRVLDLGRTPCSNCTRCVCPPQSMATARAASGPPSSSRARKLAFSTGEGWRERLPLGGRKCAEVRARAVPRRVEGGAQGVQYLLSFNCVYA